MKQQLSFDLGDTPLPSSKRARSPIVQKDGFVENPNWWDAVGLGDFAELFGTKMSIGEALQQAAVLICLDVLQQDISKARLLLRRRVKDGSEVVAPNEHHLARMLALRPNKRHTWSDFTSMMVFHLGMQSNTYAYVKRNRMGDPIALIPLMPDRVQDKINPQSFETFYDINASTLHERALLGADTIIAPEEDVIHVRKRLIDGFFGYSTLAAGRKTLQLGKALHDYEQKLFDKDGTLRGFFTRNGEPIKNDDVFRRIQGQLKKILKKNLDTDDPVLLEAGIDFKELAMKANEAEMAKALSQHIVTVCQLWRIPPHKALHLNAVKYENIATLEKQYVSDVLIPICTNMEERYAFTLLSDNEQLEYYFEYDRDAMAISDEKEKRERVNMLLNRSAMTLNQALVEFGFNPMGTAGDVRILPVNTVLIDKNNQIVARGANDANDENAKQDDNTQDVKPPKETGEEPEEKSLRVISGGRAD